MEVLVEVARYLRSSISGARSLSPQGRFVTLTCTATKCTTRIIPTDSRALQAATMNSYPPELLAQLAPVMFVAGLGSPAPPAPPTSPQSPSPSKAQDPFTLLSTRLKDVLQAQRRPSVWQPDKSKSFQVVFVEPVRNSLHASRTSVWATLQNWMTRVLLNANWS